MMLLAETPCTTSQNLHLRVANSCSQLEGFSHGTAMTHSVIIGHSFVELNFALTAARGDGAD